MGIQASTTKFIVTYPDLVIAFIGSLLSLLSILFVLWIKSVKTGIEKRVEEHITKEEVNIWPKIEKRFSKIDEEVHALRIEMINRHSEVVHRIDIIESKMPNGDIKEIKSAVLQLLDRK